MKEDNRLMIILYSLFIYILIPGLKLSNYNFRELDTFVSISKLFCFPIGFAAFESSPEIVTAISTKIRARSSPTCSPIIPKNGGPTRNAR